MSASAHSHTLEQTLFCLNWNGMGLCFWNMGKIYPEWQYCKLKELQTRYLSLRVYFITDYFLISDKLKLPLLETEQKTQISTKYK